MATNMNSDLQEGQILKRIRTSNGFFVPEEKRRKRINLNHSPEISSSDEINLREETPPPATDKEIKIYYDWESSEETSVAVAVAANMKYEFPEEVAKEEPERNDGDGNGDINDKSYAYCWICDVSFRYHKYYAVHCKEIHGNIKPFVCHRCPKSFTAKSSLMKHVATIHGKECTGNHTRTMERIECQACQTVVLGWKNFEQHCRAAHEGTNLIICQHCNKRYASRKSLTNHQRIFHLPQRKRSAMECKSCGNFFDRTDSLKRHEEYCVERQSKKFRGDKVLDAVKKNIASIRKCCDECDEVFQSFSSLRDHYRQEHPEVKLHNCHYCGKSFKMKGYLDRHTDKCHAAEEADIKLSKKYRRGKIYACDYCEESVKGITRYEQHAVEKHPGKAIFWCKVCGKGCAFRRTLWNHANDVHGNPAAKKRCKYCPKFYLKEYHLKKHEQFCKKNAEKREKYVENGGIGRYCQLCDKNYYVPYASFRWHIFRHKEYDFCRLCNRAFNRMKKPHGLAQHMEYRHLPDLSQDVKKENE